MSRSAIPTPPRLEPIIRSPVGMAPARRRQVGEPPKQWSPTYAELIPWYPKTPEKFAEWVQRKRERMLKLKAEGRLPTKVGVPNGWGGRQKELKAARLNAAAEAKEIVQYMAAKNIINRDDEHALVAMEEMVAVLRGRHPERPDVPLYSVKDRIAAAGLVLQYTKQKPEQRTNVRLSSAEDFLAAVATEMKDATVIDHEPDVPLLGRSN